MNTRTKSTDKKPGVNAAPAGTYLEQAKAKFRGAAGILVTPELEAWINQQQAAGVEVNQLLDVWMAPENAEFAKQQKALARVTYVVEELERMVERQNDLRTDMANELCAADAEKITEVAAESAQQLITMTAKVKVFTRFLAALKNRIEQKHLPTEIFDSVSQFAFNDLAKNASHLTSRNTAWQENERKIAEVAALGDVASLFVDMARL